MLTVLLNGHVLAHRCSDRVPALVCICLGRRTSAALFSRQLQCSWGQRQHRHTHQRSAEWKVQPTPHESHAHYNTFQLVSKCTYGTHRAWVCVVIGLLRHLTSTNFNVIISACPRSNNTLLSIGGTVTPARWVHWHPNDWFDLKSNASSAFLILKKSRIDHNESVLML